MPKTSRKAATKLLAALEARRWSDLSDDERRQYHVLQARVGSSRLDEARNGQLPTGSRPLSDWERNQLALRGDVLRATTMRARGEDICQHSAPPRPAPAKAPEKPIINLTVHEPLGGYYTPLTQAHPHPSGPDGSIHTGSHTHRGDANHTANDQDHRHDVIDVMASPSATKFPHVPSRDGSAGTGAIPQGDPTSW
jgi:hypothetical protein